MDDKRRSKRAKQLDEGFWDCSVCTYKNSPEAFKCEMCDVRKGTSTRKPRLNPQMVAQQAAQQFPAGPKKERSLKRDRDSLSRDRSSLDPGDITSETELGDSNDSFQQSESPSSLLKISIKDTKEKPIVTASTSTTPSAPSPTEKGKKTHRCPKLKNIDRSSATSMEVTVGDVTVVITDYKPKKTSTSSVSSSPSSSSSLLESSRTNSTSGSHNTDNTGGGVVVGGSHPARTHGGVSLTGLTPPETPTKSGLKTELHNGDIAAIDSS